jgi:hypothetical protein
MKNIFVLALMVLLPVYAWANLTNGKIPVTKNGSSNPPTLQDSSLSATAASAGGMGLMQFWNNAGTQYVNWTTNSGLSVSYQISWPTVAPTANQLPVMDANGYVNWTSASALTAGINWTAITSYPGPVNWTASMSTPGIVVNGTGTAVANMGVCTSHTGVMACIGTGGCAGYVSAYTAYNNLTCNCC